MKNVRSPEITRSTTWALLILIAGAASLSSLSVEGAEGSFRNHGVAAPIAQRAWGGANTTEDERGNSLVLLPFILPSNSLLVIDADSGEAEQFDVNYPPNRKQEGINAPGVFYMSYHTLSMDGARFYTTVGPSFREFDVNKREWTLVEDIPFATLGGNGMFEAEDGKIWVIFYPGSELVSFDPVTRELTDHGSLNEEDWHQQAKSLGMDDQGWIYTAIVHRLGNLVAYHPETGERRQLIDDSDRHHAAKATLFRATDGRVYARLRPRAGHPEYPGQWYQFYEGEARPVDEPEADPAYFGRSGWKDPMRFPDGRELTGYSLVHKKLEIHDPRTGEHKEVDFDYTVDGGANIYSLTEGADGKIYGSTGTPLMFFSFDPQTEVIEQIGGLGDHGGHINAKVEMNGFIYGAVYSSGSLIEYDPEKPWEDAKIQESRNPRHLYGYDKAVELYGRPFTLLAHPDNRHLIMGGNPRRAIAGAGLLIYDTLTGDYQELQPDEVVPNQGTLVIKALPNGDLIGGTTTSPGTNGGKRVADEAELYILDWETREVVYRAVPIPGALNVPDLEVTADGRVIGITRWGINHLFVFDPEAREIIYSKAIPSIDDSLGQPAGVQSPRVMITGPDGMIYALFRKAIVRIDPDTYELTKLDATPVTVGAGIVLQNGRIYFADRVGGRGGPVLWSYELPNDGRAGGGGRVAAD